MKKILVVLSLVCFVAVNFSNAQTPVGEPLVKKENVASVSAEKAESPQVTSKAATPEASAKEAMPGCCQNASAKACCKKGGDMKACSPAERAKCAHKMKDEAAAPAKTEVSKN